MKTETEKKHVRTSITNKKKKNNDRTRTRTTAQPLRQ